MNLSEIHTMAVNLAGLADAADHMQNHVDDADLTAKSALYALIEKVAAEAHNLSSELEGYETATRQKPALKPETGSSYDLAMKYEGYLVDISQLSDALQIVSWQFTQATIKDKELNEIRAAVLGIGNAIRDVVVKSIPEIEGKEEIAA